MGGLGSGPRCGPDGLGQYKIPDMPESIRDGLWRPEGAFFRTFLASRREREAARRDPMKRVITKSFNITMNKRFERIQIFT